MAVDFFPLPFPGGGCHGHGPKSNNNNNKQAQTILYLWPEEEENVEEEGRSDKCCFLSIIINGKHICLTLITAIHECGRFVALSADVVSPARGLSECKTFAECFANRKTMNLKHSAVVQFRP